MNTLENMAKIVLEHAGKWIKYLWGISDKALIALTICSILEYVLNVKCTASERKVSKVVLFQELCKKLLWLFIIVGVSYILDKYVSGYGGLYTCTIGHYLSEEIFNILDHADHLGVPMPDTLKLLLEQHRRQKKMTEGIKDSETL